MGFRITVIAFCKITVKGGHDSVGLILRAVAVACPLTNTGTAGIGKHHSADIRKCVKYAVPFQGIADLLRTRRNGKLRFCPNAFLLGLTR